METRLFFVLPVLIAALPQDAWAWEEKDHRRIAAIAIDHCPQGLASFLRANLDAVVRGSADPDRKFMDTANHTYEVDDGTRNNPQHVAYVSSALVSMMRNGAPREDVAYWFGALSHYVSDIDQPLHTSERDWREVWYHPLFEGLGRGFEFHGRLIGLEIDVKIGHALSGWQFRRGARRSRIDDIQEWQVENARWANSYYDEIGGIFSRKGPLRALGDERLAAVYRACLAEAIDDVIDLWVHVYGSAGVDLAGLPARNEVFRIDVDERGRTSVDGKPAGVESLAVALRSHLFDRARTGNGAPPSVFVQVDDRCEGGGEDPLREICAAAGVERFSAIRLPRGSWTSRLFRAVEMHAASLMKARRRPNLRG